MKKVILLLMIMLIIPVQVFADSFVPSNTYYLGYSDQYRMDYLVIDSPRYQAYFIAPDTTVFTAYYDFYPTGIQYFNCNGTYHLNFYDGSGNLIGHTADVVITSIVNPTCTSYAGNTPINDLNARIVDGKIVWDDDPAAVTYDVYKDGTKDGTTTGNDYLPDSSGGYSIVAKDEHGDVIKTSDINVSPSNCNECQKLSQLLQCPEWDTYMGDLTTAFQNALPPPPDWDLIAQKIGIATINELGDYFGVVPAAPDQSTIDGNLDKPMPSLDISTDASNIIPTMPPGYDTPIPFDITTGPDIDVTDNSQPFSILDPLSNLTFDDPGVPVVPGDPANNTGGILKPTTTTYPIVTPKPLPSSLPDNPVPKPSSSPSGTGGSYPVPTTIIGNYQDIPIPIYKG